ncbi:MAG: HD domain-containing protein [Candidatus Methanoperedens sp.]|nr:HD domain-containing protein [Candidatus Methanoperedens sp.]
MNEKEAIDLLIKSGCSKDVIRHCRIVAEYARKIAARINKCSEKKGGSANIDIETVFIGGLLHDIGRGKTHGIDHAVVGAAVAIENGLSGKLVNIIERHVGAGITKEDAILLGLPARDYLPVTIEEKIVAHADNLIIGERVGDMEEVVSSLRKKQLDEKTIRRFIDLDNEISSMLC